MKRSPVQHAFKIYNQGSIKVLDLTDDTMICFHYQPMTLVIITIFASLLYIYIVIGTTTILCYTFVIYINL